MRWKLVEYINGLVGIFGNHHPILFETWDQEEKKTHRKNSRKKNCFLLNITDFSLNHINFNLFTEN